MLRETQRRNSEKLRWLIEQGKHSLRAAGEVASALRVPVELRGAYAGWLGHENLGDEAIFEAVSREVYPLHLRHFAGMRKERLLAGLFGSKRLYRFGILGGGTLILGGYAGHLEPLLNAGLPCYAYGTGVLDPGELPLNGIDRHIERWIQVLKQMKVLYVRGPRSKKVLVELGIKNAEVSGDPALLHALDAVPACPNRPVLGVALYLPRRHYDGDGKSLYGAVRDTCRWALKQGWTPRLFPVSSEDLTDSIRLSHDLNLSVENICPFYENASAFIQEATACRLFLGVRLHSVILAHCAYAPAVMVAYQPKCFDYMESVGMEEWAVRSDQCEAAAFIRLLETADARRNEIRAALFKRVGALVPVLRAVGKSIVVRHALDSSISSRGRQDGSAPRESHTALARAFEQHKRET
jgi:hypothetical protein